MKKRVKFDNGYKSKKKLTSITEIVIVVTIITMMMITAY